MCVKNNDGVGQMIAYSFVDDSCEEATSSIVLSENTGKAPFKFQMDPFGDIFYIDAKGNGIFGILSPWLINCLERAITDINLLCAILYIIILK